MEHIPPKGSTGNCRGQVFNLPVAILHADHHALQKALTTFPYVFTNAPQSTATGPISDKWTSIADAPIRPAFMRLRRDQGGKLPPTRVEN
jgi:hypothetical protein